jgi:hypothetical protein
MYSALSFHRLHRAMLRRGGLLLAVATLLFTGVAWGAEPENAGHPADGKLKWARLRIGDATQWDRHIVGDTFLLDFMRRNTSLDVDQKVYAVHAADLEELCQFPFVFAESLIPATDVERHNFGEYIRRGGFFFIDACEDSSVNPNPDDFLRAQAKLLAREFPGMYIAELPPEHAVFTNVFKMTAFPPTPRGQSFDPVAGPHFPLHALILNGRTVGIISVGGLQCARAGHNGPLQGVASMRMTTNVFVFALLPGAGTAVQITQPGKGE